LSSAVFAIASFSPLPSVDGGLNGKRGVILAISNSCAGRTEIQKGQENPDDSKR
jgi:hypothetical protein